VVHVLVPPSRLDRAISRLADDGYEEGPHPSKEFSLSEGARLELSFSGNIRRQDEQQSTPLVYHFHGDMESHFQLSPVDKFLQKQLNSYRGVVDVYVQVSQNTKKANDSGDRWSKFARQLVASHHVNITKEVRITEYSPFVGLLVRGGATSSIMGVQNREFASEASEKNFCPPNSYKLGGTRAYNAQLCCKS